MASSPCGDAVSGGVEGGVLTVVCFRCFPPFFDATDEGAADSLLFAGVVTEGGVGSVSVVVCSFDFFTFSGWGGAGVYLASALLEVAISSGEGGGV